MEKTRPPMIETCGLYLLTREVIIFSLLILSNEKRFEESDFTTITNQLMIVTEDQNALSLKLMENSSHLSEELLCENH